MLRAMRKARPPGVMGAGRARWAYKRWRGPGRGRGRVRERGHGHGHGHRGEPKAPPCAGVLGVAPAGVCVCVCVAKAAFIRGHKHESGDAHVL